jgi:hypothetical protein
MNSNGSNPSNGKVPRAGTNKFASVFAKREKGGAVVALNAPAPRVVAHEMESALPDTLVAGLVPPRAPLRAAGGDDDLMSQAPTKNAPIAKPARVDSAAE